MGVVHCLAGVVPAMVEQGSGHIAVVSSVAGYRGLPTAAAYGATKAALNNMTEALKFDLEPKGIKVQLVCPGDRFDLAGIDQVHQFLDFVMLPT